VVGVHRRRRGRTLDLEGVDGSSEGDVDVAGAEQS
jgi:hypothetical protein